MSNSILKETQKLVSIKYKDMDTLLERVPVIREELLEILDKEGMYKVTSEEITSSEDAHFMNFTLTLIKQ